MSKILSSRITPLKPNNSTIDKNLIIKQNNTLKINKFNTKSLKGCNNSMVFNNNNKLYYSKHFSPTLSKMKSSLPSLSPSNSNKRVINSQKNNKIIKIINSNSLNDIYSKNNFVSLKINDLKREKTQNVLLKKINIIKNVSNNKKLFKNIFQREEIKNEDNNHNKNRYKYNVKKINHIRNINHVNIHIYSTRMNTEVEEEKNNNMYSTIIQTESKIPSIFSNNDATYDKISFVNKKILSKRLKNENNKLKNKTIDKSSPLTPKKYLLTKYNMYAKTEYKIDLSKKRLKNLNSQSNLTNSESLILYNKNSNEKPYKSKIISNLKISTSLPLITIDNNTCSKNDNIINKNSDYKSKTFKLIENKSMKDQYNKVTKKIVNRRYRIDPLDLNNFDNINNFTNIKDDNDNKKLNTEGNINIIINRKKEELNNINEAKYYLKEIDDDEKKNNNKSILVLFIKLIQIHMDIDILLDNNSSNNKFKRRITTINNDKLYKINNLINNYFNTLSYLKKFTQLQGNSSNNESKNRQDEVGTSNSFLYQKYNIFNFNLINNLFQKCIKLQICYYAAFMICLSQLSYDDIDSMIKTHFEKIIKEISNPLYNIFKIFIMNEVKERYSKMLSNVVRPNFFLHFNKYFIEDKLFFSMNKSEILKIISNNINKSSDSLKSFSNYNLKNSAIKPFGDAYNQMLLKLERKTLKKFIEIFLNMILFGELEINKQKIQKNLESPPKINSKSRFNIKKNINLGSSLYNNINESPPFLPEINDNYKYTLVLDMDETLVHFFFTPMNGMFFVRPYCFEFLNELNKYYEIVTFTAGIKDYADNILNLLDLNNNIIKYRLYRQHVTIAGFNSYKNLKLLGRDLKRIIIIDNLKENFMLQPDNGLYIKTWTTDVNDTQFIDLLNILKNIAINNVNDVRPIIQKINEKINYNGDLINPYSKINIKKIIDDEKK